MEQKEIRRGDIYHADLNPILGSEQGGYRPVLVIQNNIGNQYSPTVIVAAITSKPKLKMPTHVLIREMKELEKDSVVLLEQLRTVDKQRLADYWSGEEINLLQRGNFLDQYHPTVMKYINYKGRKGIV